MKLRIRRRGNLTRPWVVKQGRVVLSGHPTWDDALDFTHRFIRNGGMNTNHTDGSE